ncbi:hypothetical protein Taro_019082 [Colocasia esculenta]|uniref:Uncharacterized protein n=1 Tax=Colocasia esculenta TaxID=4460 RepID=A0A843V150_COLES|nr:hypothetical protein [Colocasia esculenta]
MWIFVQAAIGTTREAPIRNQHFDPAGTSNVSLDYVNPWGGNHTESACHGDRKLSSTRHENPSPDRSYGCTNIADIVTPSGLFLSL